MRCTRSWDHGPHKYPAVGKPGLADCPGLRRPWVTKAREFIKALCHA